jgi:formylmethanofuran dehydrogenase subunit E
MVLEQLKRFHGHLGPYLVLGYRMGLIANKRLGEDAFAKRALSMTGTTPPISCMIDGVQLSSGCTLGKGNIGVEDLKEPRVIFTSKTGDRSIEIALRPEIERRLKDEMTPENTEAMGRELYGLADEELFEIRED